MHRMDLNLFHRVKVMACNYKRFQNQMMYQMGPVDDILKQCKGFLNLYLYNAIYITSSIEFLCDLGVIM